MTEACIFYGALLKKLKLSQVQTSKLLIILYKQLNNLKLTENEQELLDQSNKGEFLPEKQEKSPLTKTLVDHSHKRKKRKHSAESSEDESDEEYHEEEEKEDNTAKNNDMYWFNNENTQLVSTASSFLGFEFHFGAGYGWSETQSYEGYSIIKLLQPVSSDDCVAFSPYELIELEKKVSQKHRDYLDTFLTMIGCSDENVSWYLYPSAG